MYTRVLLCLCLVVLCFGAQSDRDLYHDFLVKYKKTYSDARFEVFTSNLRLIEKENAKNAGVKLGVTRFADLTNEEYRVAKKGNFVKSAFPEMENVNYKALPASFNWVSHSVVGAVMEEGQCGASYLYTVVESISSIYAISSNTTYAPLSMNQVSSCAQNGCNGGDVDEITQYVEEHGLEFKTFKNGSCPKGKVPSGVCIKDTVCVPSGNEASLAAALVSQGPLFVAIDASSPSFQLYTSGVYAPSGCSRTDLDTSLLLVGYTPTAWICQKYEGEEGKDEEGGREEGGKERQETNVYSANGELTGEWMDTFGLPETRTTCVVLLQQPAIPPELPSANVML